MTDANTTRIRELNDQFRRTFQGGQVLITQGIQALGETAMAQIAAQVQTYDAFTKDSDPYGEHDFGSFSFQGETIFFKLDYYDRSMEKGSEDPADPEQTTRVLTILLASEY